MHLRFFVANLAILKNLRAFVKNWLMSRFRVFCVKFLLLKLRSRKRFDKYHVWPQKSIVFFHYPCRRPPPPPNTTLPLIWNYELKLRIKVKHRGQPDCQFLLSISLPTDPLWTAWVRQPDLPGTPLLSIRYCQVHQVSPGKRYQVKVTRCSFVKYQVPPGTSGVPR